MILQRLSVHDFACLGDAEFEFGSGLNIIRGPNEAGKSTLQTAFLTLFFVKANTTSRDWHRFQSWSARQMYSLSADFAATGRQWRLTKDFAAKKASLADLTSGEEWTDHDQVQEKLDELLGTGSRDVYESTAAVRQQQVAMLGAKDEIGQMLQQAISGTPAGVSVPDILNKLDKALSDLQRGLPPHHAPKNPGPLVIVRDQITTLEGRLNDLAQDRDKVTDARRRLREAEEELEELQPRVEQTDDLLQRGERRRKLEEQLKDIESAWTSLHERVDKAEGLAGKIDEIIGTEVGEKTGEESAREVAEKAAKLQDEERQTAGKIADIDQRLRQTDEAMAAAKVRGWVRPAVIAGAVSIVAGLAGALFWSPWCLLLTVGGAVVAVVGLVRRAPRGYTALLEERGHLERDLAAERGKLPRLREQLADLLKTTGVESIGELRSLADVESELRGTLGSDALEELKQELAQSAMERATIQEQLKSPNLAHLELDPLKIEGLRRQLVRDQERHKSLQGDQIRTSTILSTSEYDAEEQLRTQEQLEAAQERQARLHEKETVYQLTQEVLAEAYQQTLAHTTQAIEPRVAELLKAITQGRYERVGVAEDSFEPVVFSPEKNGEAEPGDLSCATREQLYLAARLALTEVLWPDESPPLLLDDPLVNFDPQRAAATLELLAGFAQSRQILYFTCSSRFDEYAAHIIELPTPESGA